MPERKIQSSSEMALDMEQRKQGSKLYKEMSDLHKGDMLGDDIASKRDILQAAFERGRVNLSNVAEVQEMTYRYMEACQRAKVFPTVMGLSTAFGMSRRRLNKYMADNSESETARFLETVKDVFADVMSNAALFRNADAATTIFILKNCAGFADRIEIEPVINNERSDDVTTLVEAAKMLPDTDND